MPQQMNVLHCCSCKMYQVHIVKQAKKWQCKLCNHKQILKQVFFRGSGKDCRIYVQKLNMMKEHESQTNEFFHGDNNLNDSNSASCSNQSDSERVDNKWAKFLDTTDANKFKTFKCLNSESNSNENDDESVYSHNDDTTYECLQNDYVNTNMNDCYEGQFEQDHSNDKDEYDSVEKTFDNMNSNDNNSQTYNENVIDTKSTKNMFDDNEDFDDSIDF